MITHHNTHHQDIDGHPEWVTICRFSHTFDGQSLLVFDAVTHQSQLKLTVVLPDGTRLRIPAV